MSRFKRAKAALSNLRIRPATDLIGGRTGDWVITQREVTGSENPIATVFRRGGLDPAAIARILAAAPTMYDGLEAVKKSLCGLGYAEDSEARRRLHLVIREAQEDAELVDETVHADAEEALIPQKAEAPTQPRLIRLPPDEHGLRVSVNPNYVMSIAPGEYVSQPNTKITRVWVGRDGGCGPAYIAFPGDRVEELTALINGEKPQEGIK